MNKEITKIIEEIKSYENEEMCMIILSQKQNKALIKYIINLQQENKQLKERIDKAIEYITSYESADTLMSYENKENNKGLDEKAMIEMGRRYLIIQEKLLEILGDKENEKE